MVVTDPFPVLSRTFIPDQMTGRLDRSLAMEHWSLQRMDEAEVHENARRYGLPKDLLARPVQTVKTGLPLPITLVMPSR